MIRRCTFKSIQAEPETLAPALIWDLVNDTKITISNTRRSCILLCQELISARFKTPREICQGVMSIQVRTLREIRTLPHFFSLERTLPLVQSFTVFAHSTLTDLTGLDPLSSFDTDSSFWVCDNSATGHICNNKELFTDDLVPSIFEIGSAKGSTLPTLMGTVILRVTDDEGVKHSFTLKNVNYLPNSPVNILSIRRLAELYSDDTGHPDRDGTGISSGYDSHTMYWSKGKFRKTFRTHSSGLPECLFCSGYSKLQAFSTTIASVYDDTISWAFASQDKFHNLAQLDDGSPIVHVDDNGSTLMNSVSFLNGMCLRYNDGNGTRDIVTFVGADFVDDMQIKCKVKLSDDTIALVDPETLNFIENPDIAQVPQTSDDYLRETEHMSPSQL